MPPRDRDVDPPRQQRLHQHGVAPGGFHRNLERLRARHAVPVDNLAADAPVHQAFLDLLVGSEDQDDADAQGLQERDVLHDPLKYVFGDENLAWDDDDHDAAVVVDDVRRRLSEEFDEFVGSDAVDGAGRLGFAVLPRDVRLRVAGRERRLEWEVRMQLQSRFMADAGGLGAEGADTAV